MKGKELVVIAPRAYSTQDQAAMNRAFSEMRVQYQVNQEAVLFKDKSSVKETEKSEA